MSRIETIKQNYQKNSLNYGQTKKFAQTSFGSDASVKESQNRTLNFLGNEKVTDDIVKKVAKDVESKLDEKLGWMGRKLKKFSDRDGEAQNQLINAFFTTTLAPVMIAWNPFTNQDEKTKKYSALRQPISAGIAISGGLAMTKGVNYYMSKLASEGYIDKIDLRLKPEEKEYLKAQFKKENKIKFFMNKAEKEKFKEYVKKINEKRETLFTKLFVEDPKNIEIDEKTSEIFIKDKDSKTIIGKNIPNLKTKKELDKYLEKNNAHNITIRDIAKEKFGIEFFEDGPLKGQLKPFVAEEKLLTIMASDFFHELGLIKKGSVSKDDFSKILSEIRQEERTINEVQNTLNITREKAKELVESLSKEAHRDMQMNMGEIESMKDSSSLGQVLNRFGYKNRELTKDEIKTGAYHKLQELMDMKVIDAWKTLSSKFVGKIEGFKVNNNNFAKLFIENKSALNVSNFKNYSKHVNILLNLPMTAITCYVLNWSYPRIVEALFPDLVKNDNQKGGNK